MYLCLIGGGTLDITVVEVKDRSMYEVGTSSLTGIAGDKFDDELASLVKTGLLKNIVQIMIWNT